jgi:hypothetical protein
MAKLSSPQIVCGSVVRTVLILRVSSGLQKIPCFFNKPLLRNLEDGGWCAISATWITAPFSSENINYYRHVTHIGTSQKLIEYFPLGTSGQIGAPQKNAVRFTGSVFFFVRENSSQGLWSSRSLNLNHAFDFIREVR